MAVDRRDGADDAQPGTSDEVGASAESTVEEPDINEAVEQVESEDMSTSHEVTNRTRPVVTGAVTLGAAGLATETARRIGLDQYAEAGFAERAYAKAYAQEIGGEACHRRVVTQPSGPHNVRFPNRDRKYSMVLSEGSELLLLSSGR